MYLVNLKRAGIISFSVTLLTVMVFLGPTKNISSLLFVSAQENKAESKSNRFKPENPDISRENINFKNLKTLLSNKEINFDETKVLENQVEGSKTIHVNFNQEENSTEGTLSKQKPTANLLQAKSLRVRDQTLSRQRSFELSPTQILIVSTNNEKQVLWWDLQPDPRIFRRESAADNGFLSGETLYDSNADMLISIPATKEITELYFYSPNWNGKAYSLKLIGTLNLTNLEKLQ